MSFDSFCRLYDNEHACAEQMYQDKWPEGFRCPVCRHTQASVIRTRRLPLYECRKCRYQASLTTGTVMEKSKTPLVKWFRAIYLLSHGATAVQIANAIKVTYKTAWLIAHKIRHAIKQIIADTPLTGHVRILESRYGATSFAAQFSTRAVHHPLIAAASVSDDGKMVHVRMARVPASHIFKGIVLKDAYQSFILRHVASDADITATYGLYNFARYKPLYSFSRDAVRYLNQTYCGVGLKHLKSYLDEYSYRHQFASLDQSLAAHLMRQCANRPALPYRQLIKTAA
ncbi:transposase [Cohnella lubricantis]|uniref:Transposase n=2 Tax=Cohnella lubricantis TaxID=2163172 RepID=A0A841THG2_9BACL|nr:transposase [Cohnella lubricantis]